MKLFDDISTTSHRQKCEELILTFLSKNSFYLSMPIVCGCIFIYFKEKAIQIFPTLKFKMNNNLSNITDIAFCYVMLCHNEICVPVLLDHFNEWFIPISLCDNYDARLLINHSISRLIRHSKIKNEIGCLISRDKNNFPDSYFDYEPSKTVNSYEMMYRIKFILNCLIGNLDKLEEIISKQIPEPFSPSTPTKAESSCLRIEQYQCYSYLQILSILVDLSKCKVEPDDAEQSQNSDFKEINVDLSKLIEFSHFLLKHSHPYDIHICYTLRALKYDVDDEFIDGIPVTLFTDDTEDSGKENPAPLMLLSSRIRNVLDVLVPIISNRKFLKEETIKRFATTLCFSNIKMMYQYQELVPPLITALSKLNKKSILAIIDSNKDKVCRNNIVAVVFALSAMNEKRDISQYFDLCPFNAASYDDYVLLFMERNSGTNANMPQLFRMLCTDYYTLPTRKAIWNYLNYAKVKFDVFGIFFNMNAYWNKNIGDYLDITKLLISQFNEETAPLNRTKIIDILLKMSAFHIDAFSLSYSILKDNAIENLKEKYFVYSVFSKKIGKNGDFLLDYYNNIVAPNLNPNDISNCFYCMNNFVLQNLIGYNEILSDPIKNAFDYAMKDDDNDFSNVYYSLSFMAKAKIKLNDQILQNAKEIVEKLSKDNVREKVENEKVKQLNQILIEIVKC